MEFADSGDLHSRLQQAGQAGRHLPEPLLLRYFVQLVAALAYIHSRGLMHRDLKANHIFMTSQGLLKLGDFGLVKVRCSWCRLAAATFEASLLLKRSCNMCVQQLVSCSTSQHKTAASTTVTACSMCR